MTMLSNNGPRAIVRVRVRVRQGLAAAGHLDLAHVINRGSGRTFAG